MVKNILNKLKEDYWGTLGSWQNQRPIWFLGGGLALIIELFSWAYFQKYLGLRPCELCVYIRFSFIIIFSGAFFAAIRPKSFFFKLCGYTIVIWGMIKGLIWDIRLEVDHLKSAADPFAVPCVLSKLKYPFGLPMDQWLPSHFAPQALCGEDTWVIFGLNMAECLFFVYGIYLFAILNLLLSWAITSIRVSRAKEPKSLPN